MQSYKSFKSDNELALTSTQVNGQPPLTLTWKDINVTVPSKTGFLSYFSQNSTETKSNDAESGKKTKKILTNVSGVAKPGQLMSIMGASGAGKTTLLNMLTFRNRGSLIISGEIRINGQLVSDPTQLGAVSGYVQQEDLFFATLKVKEHLKFQAMLRMGKNFSYEQKIDRIEEVLIEMNLKKCEDTVIGSPQLGTTGISGGERRRLAFASELLVNPSILFCDEPTSGLDSYMAVSIVDSMKNMANNGKTIVCTIHQPSSEIYERFDRLFLMAEGRVAYAGDSNMAYDFFSSQGMVCPSNYNPSDFYIKMLAISPAEKEKCEEKVKGICQKYDESEFSTAIDDEINAVSSGSRQQHFTVSGSKGFKSSSFTQIIWLVWRTFITSMRNPMETRINALNTVVFALLFGAIYFQLKLDQEGIQNIDGIMFLTLTNTTFSNMYGVILSFPAKVPIFFREHKNQMYRVINFYLATFLCELPRFLIMPSVFISIVYWMANLNNDPSRFLTALCTVVLIANTAVAFGSFISAISPSTNVALTILGPILSPLILFSGFYLNFDSIPVYFRWMRYLSWVGYANEVMITNQWSGVENIGCSNDTAKCYHTGEQVIKSLSMNKDNVPFDFISMGSLLVGFRFLAFMALLIKAYRFK